MNNNMKVIPLVIMLNLFTVLSFSQKAANIIGKWKSAEQGNPMELEIYVATDGKYYGRVTKDPQAKAAHSPVILKELVYQPVDNFYTGLMQPPGAGITLKAQLTLETEDKIKLVAKKLLMSKVMYLTRIQ